MSNLNIEQHINSSIVTSNGDGLIENQHKGDTNQFSKALAQEFLDIFHKQQLTPVFQPIIDMSRTGIFGYEALIRGPAQSNFESPLQLFRAATALKLDMDFEVLCRKVVIQKFAELKLDHLLFLNVSPVLLLSKDFQKGKTMEYLHEFGIDPRKVVIEVTEHQKTHQYQILNKALNYYRDMGFKVALDDLGSGYSSLRLWTEVLPDFIKIDKHFIRNVHANKIKQSFIRGILEISSGSNCKIIAEGIESLEEFNYLASLGINYLQGYYFAYPAAQPDANINTEILCIKKPVAVSNSSSPNNLKSITKRLKPISATTTVREVLEKLQKNPEINLLPIVKSDEAVGLVERFVFLNSLMQSLYGIDLYGKMKIVEFLDIEPVLVDLAATLEEASGNVTSTGASLQAFIVTRDSKYFGVATVLDLLHMITEQQMFSARYANSLTLLPGIQPTNDAIERLLHSGTAFSLAYFDLDNFKPYNDHYGYDAGDLIIKKVAEVLRHVYKKEFSLIGHIGGDDFVVVDMSKDTLPNCKEVLVKMEAAIPDFYQAEHVAAGGIHGLDRMGHSCFFPLLSVSIGIVPSECTSLCSTHLEISDLACQAKKLAKQTEGNSYFVNRRL